MYPATRYGYGRFRKIPGERGLYEEPNTGIKYIRIQSGGKDTYRSLGTKRKTQAVGALDARRAAKVAANLGIALEPDANDRSITVVEIIKEYEKAGFPDRTGQPRAEGPHRSAEQDNCTKLLEFFEDDVLFGDIRPKLLREL